MNTYSETLQSTVIATLTQLSQQQAKLDSAQIAAHYSLYYAQDTEITNRDQLADCRTATVFSLQVNDQSLISENQAVNVLASATGAQADATASNTNMATAAANVQIASNAIATLAEEMGRALNAATSALFNTESYRKIQDANNFINEVANDSKYISRLAMDASGDASEIIAAAVQAQATDFKGKVDKLLAATQAKADSVVALTATALQSVAKAAQAERQAEGGVLDTNSEADAIAQAYANANLQLNQGLQVQVVSAQSITVSFQLLPAPLPTFSAVPASAIMIPSAIAVMPVPPAPPAPPAFPAYYLALVPMAAQAAFTPGHAEQLFATRPAGDTSQFMPLPTNPAQARQSVTLPLATDADGNPIVAGNSYVAFLYVELALEYKRFLGSFQDWLSAPSAAFTPATTLPAAAKIMGTVQLDVPQKGPSLPPLKTIYFQVSVPASKVLEMIREELSHDKLVHDDKLEFYCILVEDEGTNNLDLLLSPEYQVPPIYFDLDIAQQVAPTNREKAQALFCLQAGASAPDSKGASGEAAQGTDGAAPDTTAAPADATAAGIASPTTASAMPPAQDSVCYYAVSFYDTTTDNFGNKLRPGSMYRPHILSMVNGTHQDQYVNVLSPALDSVCIVDAA
jgi:hypothetical protein